MRALSAPYSHPLCGCTETRPFRVEIEGDADWPKLECAVCHCRLHTGGTVTVTIAEARA